MVSVKEQSGKICFSEPEMFALWKFEVVGQLSDGHWENATPNDHWKFWHDLVPVLLEDSSADSHVELNAIHQPVLKNAYNIVDLAEVLGDRMVRLGRLARSAPQLLRYGTFVRDVVCNYEDAVPDNFAVYLTKQKSGKKMLMSTPQAAVYYATEYNRKDLRKDLRKISKLMKTVPLGR
jgi:hypothetical protein